MIQYKFVIIDKDGNKTWEDGPSRVLCTAKTRELKELILNQCYKESFYNFI